MTNTSRIISLAIAAAVLAIPASASAKTEKVTYCFPKYHKGELILKEKTVPAKHAEEVPPGTCDPAPVS